MIARRTLSDMAAAIAPHVTADDRRKMVASLERRADVAHRVRREDVRTIVGNLGLTFEAPDGR